MNTERVTYEEFYKPLHVIEEELYRKPDSGVKGVLVQNLSGTITSVDETTEERYLRDLRASRYSELIELRPSKDKLVRFLNKFR